MARPNPIRRIMQQSLPSISYQRRKLFRPNEYDIVYAYTIINRYVFDNHLQPPKLIAGTTRKTWGWCNWLPKEQKTGSYCEIKISDKWFCPQWFMNTLAHEMAHQYQWDVYRWDQYNGIMPENTGAHGPSFFMWRDRFDHYDLTLKTSFGQKRWFRHQNFAKC